MRGESGGRELQERLWLVHRGSKWTVNYELMKNREV